MAAFEKKLIRIAITNGDALPMNRLKGTSNTGTYFISSEEAYLNTFQHYIDDSGNVHMDYYLDFDRTKAYCYSFASMCLENQPDLSGWKEDFEENSQYFLKRSGREPIEVNTRKNDSRYFLSLDNKSELISAFRKILYASLSCLVFEEIGEHKFILYPDIDYNGLNKKEAK